MLNIQQLKAHLAIAFTACFLVCGFSKISFAQKSTKTNSSKTPTSINDLIKTDFSLVQKIQFLSNGNLEITLSKKANFNSFTLSKPNRLVVDIKDTHFAEDTYKPILPKSVKSFRTSLNAEDSLRMVFDLNKKMTIEKSSFLKTKNKSSGKILTKFSKKSGAVASTKKYYKIAKKIIVIDAGHGGKDPGTIGKYARTKEKNITLSYAKELKRALDRTKKYKVYLTRGKDFFIPLKKRVEKARKLKADLFISLHANAAANRRTSGFSIYTLSEKSSDKQSALLAKKENRAGIIAGTNFSGASKDVMKTLIDLSQRDSMNNSSIFANMVITSAKKSKIEVLQNTHRYAGFAVLTAPDMASVLIELGYLSNKYEERKLNNLIYKRRLTKSLVGAVNKYFNKKDLSRKK